MAPRPKKSRSDQEAVDPNKRHNITIADIKNSIYGIFDTLIDHSYGSVMKQGFVKRNKSGFNQKHITAANAFEDEIKDLLEGFKRLDECESKAHFERIQAALIANAEGPFMDSMLDFFEHFMDAVWDAVKDDLK